MALHPLNENQIAILEEYRSSGMSILEFAKSKGTSKHPVAKWRVANLKK